MLAVLENWVLWAVVRRSMMMESGLGVVVVILWFLKEFGLWVFLQF